MLESWTFSIDPAHKIPPPMPTTWLLKPDHRTRSPISQREVTGDTDRKVGEEQRSNRKHQKTIE